MDVETLVKSIREKKTYLCLGLDTDIEKLPPSFPPTAKGILDFNREIIQATYPYIVACKINIAFYEVLGSAGWDCLHETLSLIPKDIFTIADAKRGDIGNTSNLYAKTFFDTYNFDAVTLSPYMGKDSIEPFLAFQGKWSILLALTSNLGSSDFQRFPSHKPLYQEVLKVSATWGSYRNMMYVVGATHPSELKEIREMLPDHFFLVPGVGAQGGSLSEISKAGLNRQGGLLVNASRSILYRSSGADFAQAAAREAADMQAQMAKWLAVFEV